MCFDDGISVEGDDKAEQGGQEEEERGAREEEEGDHSQFLCFYFNFEFFLWSQILDGIFPEFNSDWISPSSP